VADVPLTAFVSPDKHMATRRSRYGSVFSETSSTHGIYGSVVALLVHDTSTMAGTCGNQLRC